MTYVLQATVDSHDLNDDLQVIILFGRNGSSSPGLKTSGRQTPGTSVHNNMAANE